MVKKVQHEQMGGSQLSDGKIKKQRTMRQDKVGGKVDKERERKRMRETP